MDLRQASLVCLLAACIAGNTTSSSQPTSSPTTHPASADVYLDVALDAITAWKGPAADEPFAMPNMHASAALLVDGARGTELDLAQARRLIDVELQQSPKSAAEVRTSDKAFGRLVLASAIGDRNRAEVLFVDYTKIHKTMPLIGDSMLAVANGLIGRDDACVSMMDDASPIFASQLAESNHPAVVARLRAAFEPGKDKHGGGARRWAEIDCAYGQFDDALTMIDSIARTDMRVRAYVEIASSLDHIRRPDEAERALAKAIEAWDRQPADEYPIYVDLDDAIDGGHADLAREMYLRMVERVRKSDRRFPSTWRWIGLAGFKLGDQKQCDAAIAALRPLADAAAKKLDEAEPTASPRSEAGYVLAALLMTVGDHDAAMAEFKRTREAYPDEDLSLSEGFPHLVRAMMGAGKTRDALDLAASLYPEPDDLDFDLIHATKAFLRDGNIASAWATANRFKKLWNLQLRCRVLVLLQLESTGQRDAALKLLRAMPSATERAGLAIMVVRELQGTRLLGMGRLSFP